MKPPALSRLAFFRHLPLLLRDRAEGLRRIARERGDLVRVPVPGKPFYLASAPADAERVLQTNNRNYRKSFDWRIVHSLLGDGLVTSHDEVWRRGRQAALPAFRRERVEALLPDMVEVTHAELGRWREEAERADFFVLRATTRLGLKAFARGLLGVDLGADAERIMAAISACMHHLDKRLTSLFDLSARFRTPGRRRFERALAVVHGFIDGWVAARRAGTGERADLLSTLIAGMRTAPSGLDPDRWLRDNLVTYLAAGHETVAVALAWSLYLLARHRDVQARLAEEVRGALGGRPPGLADLARLPYARAVIHEAMRLYPPVWSLGREAIDEDTLGGFRIPKGATVLVSPYVIHRRPDFWPDPDRFDPERFLRPGAEDSPAYLPFSAGPRYCIGDEVARLELAVMLSLAIQRFEVSLASDRPVTTEALISLRPDPDIPLRLAARG